jgi:hypothetical protein
MRELLIPEALLDYSIPTIGRLLISRRPQLEDGID